MRTAIGARLRSAFARETRAPCANISFVTVAVTGRINPLPRGVRQPARL